MRTGRLIDSRKVCTAESHEERDAANRKKLHKTILRKETERRSDDNVKEKMIKNHGKFIRNKEKLHRMTKNLFVQKFSMKLFLNEWGYVSVDVTSVWQYTTEGREAPQ